MRPSLVFFLIACLSGGMLAAPLQANPPTLSYLFPSGCQRGKEVEVRLGGLFLHDTCFVEFSGTGIEVLAKPRRLPFAWLEGPVLTLQESQQAEDYPRELAMPVRVGAKAERESRLVRVANSEGASGGWRFELGDYPEIVEKEIEDQILPTPVGFPVTINGRIFPRRDVDDWEISLRAGETIHAVISAERLGAPLDARLEIIGPTGQTLEENEDCWGVDPALTFTAPVAGKYLLRVLDANGKGSPAHVYRLTVSNQPRIENVFPLGGRAGETQKVRFSGPGLGAGLVDLALPRRAPGVVLLTHPSHPTSDFLFELDQYPEIVEGENSKLAGKVPEGLSVILNGKMGAASEEDDWEIPLAAGEAVSLESRGMALGSACRPVFSICDEAGKEVLKAVPGANQDTWKIFKSPKGGVYHLRIFDEIPGNGGPAHAYRVRVIRDKIQTVSLSVPIPALTIPREKSPVSLKVALVRHGGFDGPVSLEWDPLPEGVEITPAKPVIPKGADQLELKIKAGSIAKIDRFHLKIRAVTMAGETQSGAVSRVNLPAGSFPEEAVLVQVALPCPFKIVGGYDMQWASRGAPLKRSYKVERNGFSGPIVVELADRQMRHLQGVRGEKITLPADSSQFDYSVQLAPWMEIGRTTRSCVMGVAQVADGGMNHTVSYSSVESNDQLVAVVEAGKLDIRPMVPMVTFQPGDRVEIPVEVLRAPGLSGPVKLSAVAPGWASDWLVRETLVPSGESKGIVVIETRKGVAGPAWLRLRGTLDGARGHLDSQTFVELIPKNPK